jgi:rhodanese-related sulfurtransferase
LYFTKENYEFNTGRLDLQLKADANAVILDVRTDDAMKVLSKTITIDIHQGQGFITAIEQLDKTKNYYVYCRSGAA